MMKRWGLGMIMLLWVGVAAGSAAAQAPNEGGPVTLCTTNCEGGSLPPPPPKCHPCPGYWVWDPELKRHRYVEQCPANC